MDTFDRTECKIPSKTPGWDLDAWKYLPKAGSGTRKPLPVIVMAHGITANKSMGLAPYAEMFVSLGYAVVLFDYRRWGASAGTPRHVVFVSEQLEDYRTVVKYCRQQSDFDPHKLILWGTSFSGGHVVTLASEKEMNLSAVISQCPYLGVSQRPPLSKGFIKTILRGIQDVLRQALGMSPVYMPAVAQSGEVGLLTAPGSVDGMNSILKEEGVYPNEVSASSLFELPFYNPNALGAQTICPTLVVAAERDNLCTLQTAVELQQLSPQVQLVSVPTTHFGLYGHKQSLDAMTAFLTERVPSQQSG